MRIGIGLPSFSSEHTRIPPDRIAGFARRVEADGFAGAWVADHLRPPSLYTTSWLDPLATLATVAGVTDDLPLGTAIVILPLRNPVMAARRAATVQYLSDGRLTLGLGMGSDEREYRIVGVPYGDRSARFTEGVELVSRLLAGDRVTFEGEFFRVEDVRIEPDAPAPRVLVGGSGVDVDGGRRVARRVRERIMLGDGWIGAPWAPDAIASDWADIADHAEASGRDPASIDRLVLNYVHLVPGDREDALAAQREAFGGFVRPGGLGFAERNYLTGSVDDVRETLAAYADIGIEEAVLQPVPTDPDGLDRQLDLIDEHLR